MFRIVFLAWLCLLPLQAAASTLYDSFPEKVAALERRHGGRLGVALYRTRDDTWYTHRGDERFPMCSVFKVVAVADLLKRSENAPDFLQTRRQVDPDALMPYSKVIKKYLKTGITLREIGEACLVYSDNSAANMLLHELGGPEGVTAFARSIGDTTFRLDRWEMEMNDAAPGDDRDTTTPMAMGHTLRDIVLGNALAPPQREQLVAWMRRCATGNSRLLAGTPRSWRLAHKTGTGDYGTTNAIGVLWPPGGSPLVLVVFYTQDDFDANPNSSLIAEVAKLATQP